MQIFRGKKSGRDRRGGRPKRDRFRRRPEAAENPLADLIAEEPPARADGGARRKSKGDSPLTRISLGHIAFMLAGLLLGAGLFLVLNFLLRPQAADEEKAEERAEEKAPPPQAKARSSASQKQLHQATSPLEAVRVMLQATLAGDKETAYAQWEIAPDEVGTVKSGHALTLAEMTEQFYDVRDRVRLADFEFKVKSQGADEAQVVQTRDAVVLQVYSLRRHGPYWKVSYAGAP